MVIAEDKPGTESTVQYSSNKHILMYFYQTLHMSKNRTRF